jgi:hypothetical protein
MRELSVGVEPAITHACSATSGGQPLIVIVLHAECNALICADDVDPGRPGADVGAACEARKWRLREPKQIPDTRLVIHRHMQIAIGDAHIAMPCGITHLG